MTDTPQPGFREIATNAIRFWEWGRLGFNGVLAALTLYLLGEAVLEYAFALFAYMMIANVLYSLAYIPDVFIQFSGFRPIWRKFRWILWLIGTAFASLLAFGILFSLVFNGWT